MKFEDLSPEVKEKAKECTTVEELSELVAEYGVKLSDEELDSISGGKMWGCDYCSTEACRKVCSSASVATRPENDYSSPVSLM